MTEYAPGPIRQLANDWHAAIASAVLSGIVGDRNHTYGYHRGANYVPASDYSRQLEADRIRVDGEAAAALDMSMNARDMQIVTARLKRSADDMDNPRLNGIREFAGTLDGRTTFDYDVQLRNSGFGRWDDSHLWHVHISFLRSNVNNVSVMHNVLSVVRGDTWRPPVSRKVHLVAVAGGKIYEATGDYDRGA